ncbi:SRPBCC family protein [Haloflavibacter putidus]|uniref:SRPBCC family protein n=1 Tax=Haloflavibacter putidus TaxID=2576776 RepID=A0A507ZJY1_9FLAO|nr:SRPBCC family protein [Haloflavibacter putidus]TQD36991.1 SRPBCC family protein [Haloflavibacter putidus]
MKIAIAIDIKASKQEVWNVITNIENSEKTISGIDKVEILNNPKDSMIGLKWKETRTLFGKPSTETMWITEAVENKYYKTRAESNGAIYQTILKLSEKENTTSLTMEFNSEAISLKAKIMAFIFGRIIGKSMKKLIKKDLIDIKTASENK